MQKNVQISVLVVVAATAALLITASTFAPAAFAHKHKHKHGISIHQSITQVNSDCSDSNCQNAAVNQANVNSHDNTAVAVNIHDINLPTR